MALTNEINRLAEYMFGTNDRCQIEESHLQMMTYGLYHLFNSSLMDVTDGNNYHDCLDNSVFVETLSSLEQYRGSYKVCYVN